MLESNGSNNRFIYLLNISNLRQQILQYLPIRCIFRLRAVSSAIKLLIDYSYLPFELTIIDRRKLILKRGYEICQKGYQILLTQTRSLLAIDLSSCNFLTDDLLIHILKSNRCLKYLNVNYCTQLSPTALHLIIIYGINVKVLNLIEYRVDSQSLEGIELKEIKFEELELSVYIETFTYLGRLLQKCENLRALTFHMRNHKDGVVLETLRNCKNLKMLHFSSQILMDDIIYSFSYLAGCKNIECLSLADCHYRTDESLKAISNLTNLKELILDGCLSLTVNAFNYMMICDTIQSLSLNESPCVNDSVLEIISHYRNLRKLYIAGCSLITHIGISYLVSGCPSLEVVFISNRHGYFPQDCFQQLKVVIHVQDYQYTYPYYYCKTHRLKVSL